MYFDPERQPRNTFCGRLPRRELLHQVGGGFTSLALSGLMSTDGFLRSQAVAADGATPWKNPLAVKTPPLPAKAKNVIFLFMYGGPSHVDTFDYKPGMYDLDGKTVKIKTFGRGGRKDGGRVVGPKWKFRKYKFVFDHRQAKPKQQNACAFRMQTSLQNQ